MRRRFPAHMGEEEREKEEKKKADRHPFKEQIVSIYLKQEP